jgi:serine phosphatase RsbU (regulator of sigma subunit)
VLYSDGLIDRRTTDGSEIDINALLTATSHLATPAQLADGLIEAAELAGAADDDTTVLVSRV